MDRNCLKQNKCFIIVIILFVFITTPVLYADVTNTVKITTGTWNESNYSGSKANDLAFTYYGISCKNTSFRIDLYNTGTNRYWFNYGKIQLADSENFKLAYMPGLLLINRPQDNKKQNYYFYGGFLDVTMPKIDLNILYKGYGGTREDFHQIFSNFKLFKNIYLSHYYYTNVVSVPKSYLGPKLKFNTDFGSISAWYGFSLTPQKPNMRLFNLVATFEF